MRVILLSLLFPSAMALRMVLISRNLSGVTSFATQAVYSIMFPFILAPSLCFMWRMRAQEWTWPSNAHLPAIIAAVALSVAASMVYFFVLREGVTPTQLSIVVSTQGAIALLIECGIDRRLPNLNQIAGCAFAALAVWFITCPS